MLQPRLLNPSGMAVSIATHLTVLTVGLGYAGVRPFEAVPVGGHRASISSRPKRSRKPHSRRRRSRRRLWKFLISPARTSPLRRQNLQFLSRHRSRARATGNAVAAAADCNDATPNRQPSSRSPPRRAGRRNPCRPGGRRNPISASNIRSIWVCPPPGDDFDTPAFSAAKVATDDVAKFREQLKSCSVLPASIAPDRQGHDPAAGEFPARRHAGVGALLIEASASAKGPLLMQAAIEALAGVPALCGAAGGQIQRMESARPQLHAAGFQGRIELHPSSLRSGSSARHAGCRVLLSPSPRIAVAALRNDGSTHAASVFSTSLIQYEVP